MRHRRTVARVVAEHPGSTAAELDHLLGKDFGVQLVWKRVAKILENLRLGGRVYMGLRAARCRITGRYAIAWWPTDGFGSAGNEAGRPFNEPIGPATEEKGDSHSVTSRRRRPSGVAEGGASSRAVSETRRAHTPSGAGSTPAPATNLPVAQSEEFAVWDRGAAGSSPVRETKP